MTSKEQKKKQLKILRRFRQLTENGKGRMEAYDRLAVEFKMSVSGIRHSILAATAYESVYNNRFDKQPE